VLDYAGVDPNPARSRHVRLPREERVLIDPPSGAEVEALIATIPDRYKLPLRLLEATAMRAPTYMGT
jgi:integrase